MNGQFAVTTVLAPSYAVGILQGALALSPDGKLYIGGKQCGAPVNCPYQENSTPAIFVYDIGQPNPTLIDTITSSQMIGSVTPVFDSKGNLWVLAASPYAHQVLEFPPGATGQASPTHVWTFAVAAVAGLTIVR